MAATIASAIVDVVALPPRSGVRGPFASSFAGAAAISYLLDLVTFGAGLRAPKSRPYVD